MLVHLCRNSLYEYSSGNVFSQAQLGSMVPGYFPEEITDVVTNASLIQSWAGSLHGIPGLRAINCFGV